MNYIIRTFLVSSLLISTALADKLEIKLNGKSTNLPYWSAPKDPHGAVILINGREKAQWSTLLDHLAKQLSTNGWSAVLVNCNQGDSESWVKELPEVVNTLRQQKNNRIIVVHYGEQLKQTFNLFNKSQKIGIEGLILLSAYDMSKPDDKKPELSMPLFDITGQFDYGAVMEQMNLREKVFAQNKYLAMQIPGAQHDYEYSHQLLLSFMYGWMLKLAEFKIPVLVSYIESIAPLMPKEVAMDEDSDWTGYANELSESESSQEIIAP